MASDQKKTTMQIAMIGEEILPLANVASEHLDRGIFFGDGVYEAMRSYNGRLTTLSEHLARFERNLKAIDITAIDITQIRSRVERAYSASKIPNAIIYFHVTRGAGYRSYLCGDLKPNFFLTVAELPDYTEIKKNGIRVMTCPDLRWKRCDIKTLNLLPNVLAKRAAVAGGFDDAILVGDDGLITEGASSAFFAIWEGSLRTTPLSANILGSVTRQFILKLAKKIDLSVIEKSLTVAEAGDAEELFIATSPRGIIPVVKFNAETIDAGKIGKYTKLLSESLDKFEDH